MDESLIATTLNRDLLAQGVGGQLSVQHWEQLTQYHRRALSPRHAALFAEPNPAVIKGILAATGAINTPAVRLPLLPAATESVERASRKLISPAP